MERTQSVSRDNECDGTMGCFPDKEFVFFGICRNIKDSKQSKDTIS